MQKKINLSPVSIVGIIILVTCLALVRVFQEQLFYDPFLDYFKRVNFKEIPLPVYDNINLFLGLFSRYFINSALSLAIIHMCFKDSGILKTAGLLYALFFIGLVAVLFLVLSSENPNTLVLFYLRRFIIQPLFLILFVPAFYYQGKMK